LDLRVAQRRAVAFRYRKAFEDVHGISLMPQAPYGLHTNWLSCFLIDEREFGCPRDALIRALDEAGVESRPVWKPMHLQPLYCSVERFGGRVAEDLFRRGICLPSSSSLSPEDQLSVINGVRRAAREPELSPEKWEGRRRQWAVGGDQRPAKKEDVFTTGSEHAADAEELVDLATR
jgi:pyridoxal phosphate-dependent aminotransferase EpsN